MRVELIYDDDCPAADDARGNLRQALLAAKLPPKWTEWRRSSPETPEPIRRFGSPTILINGRDVAGTASAGAASCRIYQPQRGRLAAVPPIEMIAAALDEAVPASRTATHPVATRAKWLGVVAIPAAFASMLPVLGCALCWPAYAAMLSSLGLGFLGSARYLLPFTIALLAVALAGLGLQVTRSGYAPLALGGVATSLVLLGKFAIASTAVTYAGVAVLIAASGLTLLRQRSEHSAAGVTCVAPDAAVRLSAQGRQ